MDQNIHKLLTDRLYDKRKNGAFELEVLIREAVAAGNHERVAKIVKQLCHEYAFAVHQPHARNGGLIGLAAAAIALGSEVAKYLDEIVPPVLACFADQDARVRYYACESMYNIAKVAKGEILLYFNQVFDALCKLAADTELSVKNGAELLDRLVKDIVSESASTYVSILPVPSGQGVEQKDEESSNTTAFSLARFVPLLRERITVINPYTRMFLVGWITLLDSIPDLELVSYLPSFLGGLFKFLNDSNPDVHTATQGALDKFLTEIRKIARLKKGLDEGKTRQGRQGGQDDASSNNTNSSTSPGTADEDRTGDSGTESDSVTDDDISAGEDDWIPGQDVQVDHAKILDILVTFLGGASEQEIQMTALRWIDGLFEINPDEIIAILPRLLTQLLPALASNVLQVQQAADRVNSSILGYVMSITDEMSLLEQPAGIQSNAVIPVQGVPASMDRRESTISTSKVPRLVGRESITESKGPGRATPIDSAMIEQSNTKDIAPGRAELKLDWEATIAALMDHFLNEHEETRAAALSWLTILHRKAPPSQKLVIDDSTFPALLKTLSDTSEQVVLRDLALLSQISKGSDDTKFGSFMISLLSLFSTDRKLLETRGNLIIRQLCVSLNPERIFRTIADCLEKDDDVEFASIMIQNMNNNLITAPELSDMRRRLRNLENRDGQSFFVVLFRSWCHNAVATLSLCLLAQAYEQAYHLLGIFADLEMNLNMLIQIDKLVQLLESPVFTYLRLQLLEPDRHPYLYKCLYGLLMLLPQSSAFATLKNRLNAVSAIGYLSVPRPLPQGGSSGYAASSGSFSANPGDSGRPNRLKSRDDGIRWADLFEKFRLTQERQRRRGVGYVSEHAPTVPEKENIGRGPLVVSGLPSRPASGMAGLIARGVPPKDVPKEKERKGGPLGLGRFGGGSKKKK